MHVSTSDNKKAAEILKDKGFEISNNHEVIELSDNKAVSRPEEIATLLVKNHVPPKQLSVFEEDLEHYFLRLIKNEAE